MPISFLSEFKRELVPDSLLPKPPMYDLNDHTYLIVFGTSQIPQIHSQFKSQSHHNQEVKLSVHSSHTLFKFFNRGLLFKEFNADLASEVNVIPRYIAFHFHHCSFTALSCTQGCDYNQRRESSHTL